MCRVGGRLPPHPPSLPPPPPREYTSTPLAPRKSAAVDDLIAVAAGEDGSCHGGEETLATRVAKVLDESLVDSSDDKVFSVHSSVHSAQLYGVDV